MNYQEYIEFIEEVFFQEALKNLQTMEEAIEYTERTSIHEMEQYLLEKGYNINL